MVKRILCVSAILALSFPAFGAFASGRIQADEKPAPNRWEQLLLSVPSPERARATLRTYTAKPHMAGTPEDYATAVYTRDEMRKAGLAAEIVEYETWLPYPKERSVEVVFPKRFKAALTETALPQDRDSSNVRAVPTYSAYSPSGDVTAEVVYANYGLPGDIQKLKDLNVDVRGKILLVRYGACYRGVKVKVAEENGAAGVLIYSDPKDDGFSRGDTYPNGPFRSDVCVQRGSISYNFLYPGDPLTPGKPSVKGVKRLKPKDAAALPKIPCQPLSYRDALPIFEQLEGSTVPTEWQGGLPLAYKTGPGPAKVRLKLKMEAKVRKIWNVVATIPGTESPDEWVILGNHRDAWVFGAVDPSSGSTALLEVARSFGELLKQGWKPRRAIKLCSWDGEEFGLVGSTEWAEEHADELRQKAVVYLNVDSAVSGGNFGASAVPSAWVAVREAAQVVPDADGKQTINANWLAKNPNSIEISFGQLGGGSDFAAFLQHLGIPCADMSMGGPYGVYHSTYDSFTWMEKFGDPDFTRHAAMSRILGLTVLRFADSPAIPLNLAEYAHELLQLCWKLEEEYKNRPGKPDFIPMTAAAAQLILAAEKFEKAGDTPETLASRNRVRMRFERMLTDDAGLAGRPWFRHVVYAPGIYKGYGAEPFSGVRAALARNDTDEARQAAERVTAALKRATQLVTDGR